MPPPCFVTHKTGSEIPIRVRREGGIRERIGIRTAQSAKPKPQAKTYAKGNNAKHRSRPPQTGFCPTFHMSALFYKEIDRLV